MNNDGTVIPIISLGKKLLEINYRCRIISWVSSLIMLRSSQRNLSFLYNIQELKQPRREFSTYLLEPFAFRVPNRRELGKSDVVEGDLCKWWWSGGTFQRDLAFISSTNREEHCAHTSNLRRSGLWFTPDVKQQYKPQRRACCMRRAPEAPFSHNALPIAKRSGCCTNADTCGVLLQFVLPYSGVWSKSTNTKNIYTRVLWVNVKLTLAGSYITGKMDPRYVG
jgi:uncharacterized membrane protein YqaE (UPF0057 family)